MSVLTGVNNALNTAIRFSQMREQKDYRDALKAKTELDIITTTANQSFQNLRASNLVDDIGNLNEPAIKRVLRGEGSAQENLAVGSIFSNLNPEQFENVDIGLTYDPTTKTVSAPTLSTNPETGEQTPGAITVDGTSDPNSEVARLSPDDAFANLKGLYSTSVLSKQDLLDVDDMKRNNTLFRGDIASVQAQLLDDLKAFPEVQRGVLGELSRLERDEDKLEFAIAFNLDYLDKDPKGVLLGMSQNYDENSLREVYEMVQAEGIQDPRQVSRLPIAKQTMVFAASLASMPDGEAKNKAAARYGDLIASGITSNIDLPDAGERLTDERQENAATSTTLQNFGKNTQALTSAILTNESDNVDAINFNETESEKDEDERQAPKSLIPVNKDPEVVTAMQQLFTDYDLAMASRKPGLVQKANKNLQDGVVRVLTAYGNQITNKSLSPLPFNIDQGAIQGFINWWNNRTPGQQQITPTSGSRLRISADGTEYGIASVAGNSDISKNPIPAVEVAKIFGPEFEQTLRAALKAQGATY